MSPNHTPNVPPERRSTVDQAREGWIRRLIDLSRRNNLLYFRDLKTGTLDLSQHDLQAMANLLAGESVALTLLLPDADKVSTAARVQEIRRRALSNLEERGLETLFLGFGMATWPAADEGRPPESAILLMPVAVESRGRDGRTLNIHRKGEVQVNLALLHVLETEHGIKISPERLLEEGGGEDEPFDPTPVLARLKNLTENIQDFEVKPRVVLGNFSFQKMAMVKDLQERAQELAAHDLIAAIAGDTEARRAVTSDQKEIDPRELDHVPPDNEFLVLDTDSSQQKVIVSVLDGQHGVIHGPPGTGKSQTIANLIATLAANGRRVLFVAEKRAALEVVLHRLKEVGLGHLALDLHGADVTRREVMIRIAESLTIVRQSAPVDSFNVHHFFTEQRKRLNDHVNRLHSPRSPSGLSVYKLQGQLLRIPAQAHAKTRWRGKGLDCFDRQGAEAVKSLLVEAGGFGGLFLRDDPSPWNGAVLPDGLAVQQAIDLATSISQKHWPALLPSLTSLVAASKLAAPTTLTEAQRFLSILKEVAGTLTIYSNDIFRQNLELLSNDLFQASRGTISSVWSWCTNAAYRNALRVVRALRRAGPVPARQLFAEITAITEQLQRWKALSLTTSIPRTVPDLETASTRLEALLADLSSIEPLLGRQRLAQIEFGILASLFNALVSDSVTPYRIPRLLEIERELAQHGAGAIIEETRTRKLDTELWPKVFEHAWLASCLDQARTEDPALAGFNGRAHERFVEEFRRLDRERAKLSADRVRRTHAERVIQVMNTHSGQDALVRREAEKKSRHLPLRKLISQAPDVLTALCPCWMASPLSVSQLLDADRRYFDIVIFDEASQVFPEDAVPALLRASQAVVAGDEHQLPPTFFFVAEEEDDENIAPGPTAGFESILNVMSSFLGKWPLAWHYRSRDEALIAFSNRHIYNDRLITFPGPGRLSSIQHVLVPQTPARDGEEDSSSSEVQRVVELVLEHATSRPDETLGVIAMGIRHANRVYAAIEEARLLRPDLDDFFDTNRNERFFVKNIERVQGDERDAIILTVGYGKDHSGKLPYRFGPLNMEGGERRLNVAITRARNRLTLVSSFDHHDMDPARSSKRGVELLRLYLQYAASNGSNLGDTGHTGIPLNDFEADVFDTLAAKGIALLPQWGASSYRIDMIAQHPQRPGRFVLAIECDGATYHSAPTARDRDRLRQQHLEALGWRFHRIWSTDWFMRREDEIKRTLAAYEMAIKYADRVDAENISGACKGDACDPLPQTPSSPENPTHAMRRDLRPNVPRRDNITEYRGKDLVKIIRWIQSDGLLRTDDDLLEEMVRELGFQRRGPRIEEAIRSAIEKARSPRRE